MHNCEEFRERITEQILDREDVATNTELQHQLIICSGCSEFYAQSLEMLEVLDGIDLSISESQWTGIDQRLRATILNAAPPKPKLRPRFQFRPLTMTPFLVATAALLLITVTLSRIALPQLESLTGTDPSKAVYVEHTVPLDPVTIDFLEESELLLRNVMKIQSSDIEDLADAKKTASEQLGELEQRKQAAAYVQPVVDVMDTYETVLRDLRNVDERSTQEDITDIQKRIQKNGLIANMKAFQPRVTEISFGLR